MPYLLYKLKTSQQMLNLSFGWRFLVPGWSRIAFFLRNRYKINNLFFLLNLWRLTRCQMIKNLALLTFIWTTIEKCLTSWISRKLVPVLKGFTWSCISIEFEKNIKNENKLWYALRRRVWSTFGINFSLIHACLVIFRWQNLVPDFGPGSRALVLFSFFFCRYILTSEEDIRWDVGCLLVHILDRFLFIWTPFWFWSLNRLPIWNSQNCSFSSGFHCRVITGSLMRLY